MNKPPLQIVTLIFSSLSLIGVAWLCFEHYLRPAHQPNLIYLGNLQETKLEKGRYYRTFGYISENGDSDISLSYYPSKEIAEMKGFHSKWMETLVWYPKEKFNTECINKNVVVTGRVVFYLGMLGFDEIFSIENLESKMTCIPRGEPINHLPLLKQSDPKSLIR